MLAQTAVVVLFALSAWQRDPAIRMEDAYKWLFQATMGGEHAVDREGAMAWLEDEWATLGAPLAGEVEWEPLTPDGRLGRVNLRPFRARGGDPLTLGEAFVRSARSFTEDRDGFLAEWRALGDKLLAGSVGTLTRADWEGVDTVAKTGFYGAMHHSATYERDRKPAYRVLTRADAEAVGSVKKEAQIFRAAVGAVLRVRAY